MLEFVARVEHPIRGLYSLAARRDPLHHHNDRRPPHAKTRPPRQFARQPTRGATFFRKCRQLLVP